MSDLRRRLEDRIAAGDDLLALRRVLEACRDDGGTQDAAVAILEEMRAEARDEAMDDLLCDLLDLSTGFCSEHMRVWR